MFRKAGWKKEVAQIVLPVGLTIILFSCAVFFFAIPTLRASMMDAKREMIKELTNTAWDLIRDYAARVGSGEFSLEEAQERAKKRIFSLRYGPEEKDYFWINNMQCQGVLHPYQPELEGADLSHIQDSNGKFLFIEFVRTVEENGEGYVDYLWQWKDDPNQIAPKISYVKGFAPWGWIIGTGLYVDDVEACIAQITYRLNIAFLTILLLIITLSLYIIWRGVQAEKDRIQAYNALRDSERRLADIIDFFPDATLAIDTNGVIIAWNCAMEELSGVPAADMLGKGNYEYSLPFYDERVPILIDLLLENNHDMSAYEDVKQKGKSFYVEKFIPKLGEKGRRLYAAASCLYDRNGVLVGGIESLRDITEKHQALEEMKRLRNLLKNIIDSMPSMLIGVDPQGCVTQWNLCAENLTGLTPEKAQGRMLKDVLPQLQQATQQITESIRTRQARENDRISVKIGDKTKFMDMTIYPLIANGIEGAVVRLDDLTERIRIEEMMVQSEKMLSVGGLAAGMAHEINNPLAGMLQNLQVIRNRIAGKSPKDALAAQACGISLENLHSYHEMRDIFTMIESVLDAGQRAARIVNNMLSFARKGDSSVSSHNIAKLLDTTVELAANDYDLKKKVDFKDIKIERVYAQVPEVPCEASKIQQVFLNILRNGAQAMWENPDQKEPPKFTLRIRNAENMVCIEIEDNGPGMPKEIRKRIFEPFFTTKSVGTGTGLGLSVSYFIVTENHKGRMHVDAEPGKGSKFTLCLPVHRSANI